MIFLDPKSDIAFKKLFGDITHKNIVISFLNSVLERSEGQKIVDVAIKDPNNVGETVASKASAVDVRCTDERGHEYIIEMQVVNQEYYAARAQYYSSLSLGRQLAAAEKYQQLLPVIFVGILDFSLFKSPHCVSHHLILDSETHAHELRHLTFHFVELPKFKKELHELETILDKWIYFFKHAGILSKVPTALREPVLQEAFDVLAQSNWSRAELEAYDRYLDAIRSYETQIDVVRLQGIEEGKIEVALQLLKLKVGDKHTIAQATGLSIEDIEKLNRKVQ